MPWITLQPVSLSLAVGATATFIADARGSDPLAYQWFFKDTNSVPGATGPALVIPNVQLTNAGNYHLVVTNSAGAAVSELATLAVTNLNPSLDTDGDGIPDSWMNEFFKHPTGEASDRSRAGDDADSDGMSNLEEYIAGTNPLDASSVLRIESVYVDQETNAILTFTAMPEKTYSVEWRSGLEGPWQKLVDVGALAAATTLRVTNRVDLIDTAQFYRLVTPRLP